MNNKSIELIICYIEQFGFDIVIGPMKGLNLSTMLELKRIQNE